MADSDRIRKVFDSRLVFIKINDTLRSPLFYRLVVGHHQIVVILIDKAMENKALFAGYRTDGVR